MDYKTVEEMHEALVLAGFECLYPLKIEDIYEHLAEKLNEKFHTNKFEVYQLTTGDVITE